MRNFVIFLWLLGPGRNVSRSRAENPRIVLPPAATALELVGIAAERIGFAHIADDPAILWVVDDGMSSMTEL